MWKALPLFLRALGRWPALAWNLALAADILRTAAAPTWHDMSQLAAIAVLWTGFNYGMERENACEERRKFTYAARANSD